MGRHEKSCCFFSNSIVEGDFEGLVKKVVGKVGEMVRLDNANWISYIEERDFQKVGKGHNRSIEN